MTTALEDLAITRVTLCAEGTNQEAEILLFKAQDAEKAKRPPSVELPKRKQPRDVFDPDEDEERKRPFDPNMDPDAPRKRPPAVTLPKRKQPRVAKSPKAPEPPDDKEAPVADAIEKADHEAVVAERDALQAEIDALNDISNDDLAALRGFEIAKAQAEDDVLKAVPAEVRERIEKAEARVEKMEADARRSDFVRKAETDFGDLAPAAELGPVLEEIDRKAPEAAKALDQMLKAVAARAETSELFKTLGSDQPVSDDPYTVAKARADEIRNADPTVSETDALQRAMAENPEAAKAAFSK